MLDLIKEKINSLPEDSARIARIRAGFDSEKFDWQGYYKRNSEAMEREERRIKNES